MFGNPYYNAYSNPIDRIDNQMKELENLKRNYQNSQARPIQNIINTNGSQIDFEARILSENEKPKLYKKYKTDLYEMANGKILTEEMAFNWVENMKPKGEHWTFEEISSANNNLGYNLKNIDFYVVANMMYNDYYDLVKDDEELALKMAYMWLNDEDSVKDKLYEYYKYIPKED